MKNKIKALLEKLTGYWFYKSADLPAGVSLKHDLNRFDQKALNIFFDVGANTGQTAKAFDDDFSPARIYCFEPVNETFEKLKNNCRHLQNVIPENFAFGESQGQKQISLFADWDGGNSLNEESMCQDKNAATQTVVINTVDNYCAEKAIKHIDLLKIDTEGYELNVLQGATGMLKEKKISFILCEAGYLKKNMRNTQLSALCEHLATFGYFIFAIYNGGTEDWDKGMCYSNVLFVNAALKLKQ